MIVLLNFSCLNSEASNAATTPATVEGLVFELPSADVVDAATLEAEAVDTGGAGIEDLLGQLSDLNK